MSKTKYIAVALLACIIGCYTNKALNTSSVQSPTEIIKENDNSLILDVDLPVQIPAPYSTCPVKFTVQKMPIDGVINAVTEDTKVIKRLGGEFNKGTFCFAVDDKTVTHGMVTFTDEKICYIMDSISPQGFVTWVKKNLSDIACIDLPVHTDSEGSGAATLPTSSVTITSQIDVPLLNSRPSAKTVLYLDFIGGKVQDPMWVGGKLIDAKPAYYTADQIKTTFDVTAERYAAFNVNVTTDLAAYTSAPVGRRMRIILTTTNVLSGYGGYAYIGSLKYAGTSLYSPGIFCFAFVNNVGNAKNAGEVCAHELGHTFGLSHDGTIAPNASTYYAGQGDWAPIMGVTYYKPIAQWSKGEYTKANNKQDDISIIAAVVGAGTLNTGFTAFSNLTAPQVLDGTLSITDTISNNTTSRYFVINPVNSGSLQVNVKVPNYGALNAAVELRDSTGQTILSKVNTVNNLSAQLTTNVTPGKYIIKVYGEGEGSPTVTGYSSYGSIGSFVISGSMFNVGAGMPIIKGSLK